MNLAAHIPEFSDGCSITELLSRIATQASQLASRNKQIVDLTSQNADLEPFAKLKPIPLRI